MASASYSKWLGERRKKLLEIRSAHHAVGGTGPGRRTATQQINQAYALLVLAQFQGFCRDLHTEAADWISTAMPTPELAGIFRTTLTSERKLDRGNANSDNIRKDFNRLEMSLWDDVSAHDPRSAGRRKKLDALALWRNAISRVAELIGSQPW
jgi:hypothetical protein